MIGLKVEKFDFGKRHREVAIPRYENFQSYRWGLGHKDPQSTKIYARLAIDPVKDAMEKAQSAMFDLIASECSQAGKTEENS